MTTTIKIEPVTRIEGHLDIEVNVESVDGVQQVIDAKCSGIMFRGFEIILKGRDPRDATHYTQRICGVCPVSHGMASTLNLESAFGVQPPDNGRIIRNLILGANFIMSHVLHFYHLTALDYINTEGIADMSPWTPRFVTPDMVADETAVTLVAHYVKALEIRRKAHQMGAIFGAKLPCSPTFVPGGCTEVVTSEKIADFSSLLSELCGFIDTIHVPDVLALADLFLPYYEIGTGCGNLLAYGVFDLDVAGDNKLLARGCYTDGAYVDFDPDNITEYVKHSWYTHQSGNLNPSDGITEPNVHKNTAYSWIKSPRYLDLVHEVGPLARMWINGDYRNGISVLDRIAARALECKKVADAMVDWLNELEVGEPVYIYSPIPESACGMGLTEAPRGALGHWIDIRDSKISRYQVITPTSWNASPADDHGIHGPIEQALIGTPVLDVDQPVELLRVVHSFDPCIACAVHLMSPEGQSFGKFRVM
jgi:hydrogenase large subunit